MLDFDRFINNLRRLASPFDTIIHLTSASGAWEHLVLFIAISTHYMATGDQGKASCGKFKAFLTGTSLLNPERYLLSFSLDLYSGNTTLHPLCHDKFQVDTVKEKTVGHFRHLDLHLFRGALHLGSKVHSFTKEAITRHSLANYTCHSRSRCHACSNQNLITLLGLVLAHKVDSIQGKQSHPLGTDTASHTFRSSCNNHVLIPNSLYLVHLMLLGKFIQLCVQLVEHLHYLSRSH
mmetsp:Transcript_31361/g.53543  ORF Transcript_31361/g.53543 Transcript_31361/m.53543 type:complete len:235 (+) Transcript_31361:274-978(+)